MHQLITLSPPRCACRFLWLPSSPPLLAPLHLPEDKTEINVWVGGGDSMPVSSLSVCSFSSQVSDSLLVFERLEAKSKKHQ